MTINKINELAAIKQLTPIQYLNEYSDKKIDIYYKGWEADEIAWKIDNTIFRTNHGVLYIEKIEDFISYIKELEEYIEEAKNFIRN